MQVVCVRTLLGFAGTHNGVIFMGLAQSAVVLEQVWGSLS